MRAEGKAAKERERESATGRGKEDREMGIVLRAKSENVHINLAARLVLSL